MSIIPKICIVEECPNTKIMAKGYCAAHYLRLKRYGRLENHIYKFRRESLSLTASSYRAMVRRCTKPNDPSYFRYGSRGISVCDRWLGYDGYAHFKEDMGDRLKGTSLDRINVFGNYEPSNCRWATPKQQSANRGIVANNTSGYIGVFWYKRDKLWVPRIEMDGQAYALGRFTDPEQAAIAYDCAVIFFRGYDGITNIL